MKTYTYAGYRITEFDPKNLRLLWWDKPKNGSPKNAFNLGFFGNYSAGGTKYTLPGGNVCVDSGTIGLQQKQDVVSWGGSVDKGKVRLTVNQNGSTQFKNKAITTLVISELGLASFYELLVLPPDCKYAISGYPIIRKGEDVSYTNTFKPQGWYDDILRSAYRNMIGGKGQTLYLISGKSNTSNLLKTSEVFNALKTLKLDNLIGLDGGGSYISTVGAPILKTSENRRINTIGIIDS